MDFIIDAIVEWLKGLLVDGIMGNLEGLFTNVNTSVGEIATQVGTTPAIGKIAVSEICRIMEKTPAFHDTTDLRNCHSANRRGHPHFCYDL